MRPLARFSCAAVLAVFPLLLPAQNTRTLIKGVPFVSWHVAGISNYDNKDELNPSVPAARRMIAGYWRDGLSDAAQLDAAAGELFKGAVVTKGASLGDIKAQLLAGVPVYVTAALSPVAHPIRPTLVEVLATQKVAIANGPTSELLGPMVALDDMGKVVQTLAADPMREPLYMTAHVIVGFDDSKQLIMMHDATFGPATEMSYADFEKAWKASGSEITVIHPADMAAVVARRAGAAPYRNRTADERAAEGYITAYTLAATGKLGEAEQTLRRTLSVVEASDGYKHLLNLELAMVLESQQRGPEALKAWEETVKYLPDIPIAWQHMATMYKKVAKDDRLAAYALQQYTALKKDPDIRKRMAASLPGDFLLVPFRDVRGWCGF